MDALQPDAETVEVDPAKKERIERRLAMPAELAEIGMKLARANGEKALAKQAAEAEADTAAVKPPPSDAPSKDDPSLSSG
jgi:hypothetical protein